MPFLNALHSGRTLLMDGAMGTELIRRGHVGPTWLANLDAPDLVHAIHADYVAAGAEVLLANTFMANSYEVTPSTRLSEVHQAAIRLARSVPGPFWLLGSLGPISRRTEGPNFADREIVMETVDSLAGVDGILLETCSDASAFDAAGWIRDRHPRMPVLVSFTFRPNDPLRPEDIALLASDSGIAALGVNCGLEQSPTDLREVLRSYRDVCTLPLFARANAGSPTRQEKGWTYPQNAETWAKEMSGWKDVAMIGGCCGTTPEFIRALRSEWPV